MTLFPHQSGQKRAVLASICPPVDPVHPHHLSRASCSEIDSDKINHWWGRALVRMIAIIIVIAVRRKVRIDYGHFYRGAELYEMHLRFSIKENFLSTGEQETSYHCVCALRRFIGEQTSKLEKHNGHVCSTC